ncbi:TPA: hypothetical protein EYP70_00285 [Candidatus Bathyarchaeota archaeon]|nr:hypothetical protein [Candidatus Bathyarchaeota archaeon]
MVKFRLNIFFVIAIVCILLLVGYLWLVLLPAFEGSMQYQGVRIAVITMTAFLALSVLLLIMSMKTE